MMGVNQQRHQNGRWCVFLASLEGKVGRTSKKSSYFAVSPFLTALAGVKRADYDADRSKRWTAQFHPLVTYSIDEVAYRQFNYRRLMKCTSQLARWLLSQLVLKYTFAAITNQFEMRFSTIKRDSALLDGYPFATRQGASVTGPP